MRDFDPSDFAFLYFAVSALLVILIPLTYSLIATPLKQLTPDPKYKKAPASATKAVQIDIAKNRFFRQKSYYVKVLYIYKQTFFWTVLVLVFINAYQQLPDPELMRGFDPYAELGVTRLTPIADIKRAHRELARKYHPDKYEGDPVEGQRKFNLIMKANECLTDPRKIQNCVKYGSPDGPQSYKIGIALPSFIGENKTLYLTLIFGGLIFVIVATLITLFINMGKYDKNGILTSNQKHVQQRLLANKNTNLAGILETIQQSEQKEPTLAPGILYQSIDMNVSLLNHFKQAREQQTKEVQSQIQNLNKQLLTQIEALPNIIQQKGSNYQHPSNPIVTLELGHQDEAINADELTTHDLFVLNVKLENTVDQFIQTDLPILKLNIWNILLLYKGLIIDYRQVKENSTSLKTQFKFIPSYLDPRITQFQLQVLVLSDSYPIKIDKSIELKCKQYIEPERDDSSSDSDNDKKKKD